MTDPITPLITKALTDSLARDVPVCRAGMLLSLARSASPMSLQGKEIKL